MDDAFDTWFMLLSKVPYMAPEQLARLAFDAGRHAEREACANLCKAYADRHAKRDDDTKAQAWMMLQCAAEIRRRSNT